LNLDDKGITVGRILGLPGRLLGSSKLAYLKQHPDNRVFFNANLYDSEGTKIWFGDVDLTAEEGKLRKVAKTLEEAIFITREQPWRFENVTLERLTEAVGKDDVARIMPTDG